MTEFNICSACTLHPTAQQLSFNLWFQIVFGAFSTHLGAYEHHGNIYLHMKNFYLLYFLSIIIIICMYIPLAIEVYRSIFFHNSIFILSFCSCYGDIPLCLHIKEDILVEIREKNILKLIQMQQRCMNNILTNVQVFLCHF